MSIVLILVDDQTGTEVYKDVQIESGDGGDGGDRGDGGDGGDGGDDDDEGSVCSCFSHLKMDVTQIKKYRYRIFL